MKPGEPEFIHRFVPGSGGPTLLTLHGTGGDESDLIPLARAVAPSASVLSPRGRVLENGRPRWFRRIAEGVFDIEDLRLRTRELAEFVSKAVDRYGVNSSQLVALGFSNGANIASSLLLLQPGVLSGGVLLRGMVPLEPATIPDLSGVPVLLSSGRADPLVPADNAARLASLLQDAGAAVTHHWISTGHGLVEEDLSVVREWLGQFSGSLENPDQPAS